MKSIKMFFDYACPFSYVGFSIADRLRKEENINIEFLPHELNPEISQEPSKVTDFIPKDILIESYKRIEKLGEEYGLIYKNKRSQFNTHRVILAALYSKKEDKFYEFSKETFKAIFEEELNVADPLIVNEIGMKANLNIVEMNNCIDSGDFEELERSKELYKAYEVDSLPTFILENGEKVTELKSYDEFKKDLMR